MLLAVVTGILLAGTPEAAATQTPPAEKPVEKKVCRRDIETGSLIKGKKICYTAKQWQKITDANREQYENPTASGSSSGQ